MTETLSTISSTFFIQGIVHIAVYKDSNHPFFIGFMVSFAVIAVVFVVLRPFIFNYVHTYQPVSMKSDIQNPMAKFNIEI